MKDLRCVFGSHRFSDWFEVGAHLERECMRCGTAESKYPDPLMIILPLVANIINHAIDIYMWNAFSTKKGHKRLRYYPAKSNLSKYQPEKRKDDD